MRFQVFLANFATTLFLVEQCEAVHTLLLSDLQDAKSQADAAALGSALADNQNYANQVGWDNKMDASAQGILLDMDGTPSEKLAAGTREMKKALMDIPELKAIIMTGELANLAFQYMKQNTPEGVRVKLSGAFASGVKGRFSAFKNWLSQAWSGKSDIQTIIGDYEDYLSLFPTNSKLGRISLHQYFDATRAPGDRGNFSAYQEIMNRMGMSAEKDAYVGIRQESRNVNLREQYIDSIAKINILEGQIAQDLLAGKKPTSPFPEVYGHHIDMIGNFLAGEKENKKEYKEKLTKIAKAKDVGLATQKERLSKKKKKGLFG